jgi:hypothetical protein
MNELCDIDPWRSMHKPVLVAHSSFIEGSHMTKNKATGYHYAECHYAECRHAECRYAECLGASSVG